MSPVPYLATTRTHRRTLFVLLGIVLLGVTLVIGIMVWLARDEALRGAGITARNYTSMLEARLDATLRRCDAVLQELARNLPKAALSKQAVARYGAEINADMNFHTINFDEISALRVFDAEGDLLYTSSETPVAQANISDREFFRRLRDKADADLVFSEVIVSRVSGRQTVGAARALHDRQGRFLGIVVAGLALDHFQKHFQSLDIGPRGLIAIRRSDNFSQVARWPARDSEANSILPPNNPTRAAIDAGKSEATLEFASTTDGIVRIVSVRALQRYPFYVLAGLARDDVLAGWKLSAAMVGVAGFLLLGLLAFLLLRLARMVARERQLVAEQREREEVFRHLFEDVNDPILLIKDGLFIDCNAATLKLLGYRGKAELLNRSPPEISPLRQPDGSPSQEKASEMITTALEAGYHRFEWLHTRADGSTVPVEVTLTPITMGGNLVIHTLWRDITERQAAEQRLRLLADVFERISEAIMITDRDNRVVEVNRAFTLLTGYDLEDVRGQDPRILSSGRTTTEEYRSMWRSIGERSFWQGEVWDRRKDGSFYPKWLTISAVRNADGEVDYYIGSFTDMTERKAAEERINHLALHDTLTGLPNRYNLQGRLDQALAAARRNAGHLALMFIDLDRFKNINDTLGHHVGDDLLREVATRLTHSVRDSDVVARLGGDEFVVVLTGVEAATAGGVADKVLATLSLPYRIQGHELHTTPSIGITVFPDDGDNAEALMQNADTAMYHAKSAGRNNVQFFTAALNQAAKARHELEGGLRLALERGELELAYQPQVDSHGGIIGAEALLRWNSAEHGLVSPLHFVPLAEETGLILPIGRWVLATACARLKEWSTDPRTKNLELSVNVSPREFREADFVDQIRLVLATSGADPRHLKLELTEGLVLDNVEDTIRKMREINSFGISFSLDDFGTGYSSLSYLTRLPLVQLKIDRAFVFSLPDNASDGIVTQTIITLGKALGLNVIAEGVETEAQREFLESRGCHAYQGYLFSRPLSPAEFGRYLDAH